VDGKSLQIKKGMRQDGMSKKDHRDTPVVEGRGDGELVRGAESS